MTTMDLRAAISDDMNGFTPDMLQMVAEYVKSLRRRQSQPQQFVTPLVASLFTGHKTDITDEELKQMKDEYLKEKYL